MIARVTILAIAATMPASALAAQDTPAIHAPSTPATDPNEKICQNVTQIGSRLTKRRVCATRAEWAERRLQDRQDAEHIQRSITGSTCVAAKNNVNPIC